MVKVIKNIRVINPSNDFDKICDVHIENGIIKAIEEVKVAESISSCTEASADISSDIIDGTGLIAAPGLVDVHVHFRDPGQTHKEDIHTGAMASIAGGYTSVVMMANTVPTIDNSDTLKYVLEKGDKEPLHIYSCVNATMGMKGEEVVDYDKLIKEGAVGITDDGKPILDEKVVRNVFVSAAKLNVPVSLHEEDPKYISENGVNSGKAANGIGLTGSDRMAEISIIERDLKIASEEGVKLNIQHISTKEGVELVRAAKLSNSNIHAEATPHHFSLNDEAVGRFGTLAKMNPPLRSEEDRLAIIKGLRDGTIDIIATDHAPHSAEEKSKEFKDAPSGIIGLETALSLGITNLVNQGELSISKLFELMSLNPARLYGIDAGELAVGKHADIVIIKPDEEYVVKTFQSKSFNSPFIGMKLCGKVKYTICDGNIVYSDKNTD